MDSASIIASTSGSISAAGSALRRTSAAVVVGFSASVPSVAVGEDPCSIELQALIERDTKHTAMSARTDFTPSISAVRERDVGLATYDPPMSENLRNYVKTLYAMDAVVRRVPDDAWDNPSPCADWSGREALGHTIWGLKNLTAGITGGESPAQQAEADVAGADPVSSWTGAMDAMLAALDQQGVLGKEITTPFGHMSVDDAIGTLFIDPLAHTFDVARAAGIDPAMPADVAAKGLATLRPFDELIRRPGAFDARIDLTDEASAVDRFIAFTGRQP